MVRELITEVRDKTDGTGEGFVTFDKLTFQVKVLDSRKVYGRVDVLVTPTNGSGEQWIDLARVHVNK